MKRLPSRSEHGGLRPNAGPKQQTIPIIYKSIPACSAATKIPTLVISQAKREHCAAFRNGKIYLVELLAFIFQNGKSGAIQVTGSRSELDHWKAKREKLRFQKESGALVLYEDMERDIAEGMAIVFTALDRIFCNELPPSLVGIDEMEMRNRCKAEIERLKDLLRERYAAMAKEMAEAEAQENHAAQEGAKPATP